MRKLHKAMIVGGVTLGVLVPAGVVAADQMGNGNGNGNGPGRGNGTMVRDCDGDGVQDQDRIQARDGTGVNHEINSVDGSGSYEDRPMDGTGRQYHGGN